MLSERRRRLAARALMLLAASLSAGCAELPASVPRPASQALVDVAASPLARLAADSTPAHSRHLSGFRLLPDGGDALATRLELMRRASHSVDAQLYSIADDDTGRQFLRALRDAAERGVRVRLLVDDLHAGALDASFAALAAHRLIDVRLFNPLPVRGRTVLPRLLLSMHRFDRINRRMHNKLFIADNSLALAGGRNVGDEYFMRSATANFLDLDVLAAGPVVGELSASFDSFWNHPLSVPVGTLVAEHGDCPALARIDAPSVVHRAAGDMAAQIEAGRLDLQFAAARVWADSPAKAAKHRADAPGQAMASALKLMTSARSEVLIASPYFVPGVKGLELMQTAAAKGVRMAVLTNSLSTTDEPLAYWGYARYRQDILRMGVALAELSPLPQQVQWLHGASSLARLHAKFSVLDRRWLLIGSMNMDFRSSRLNTEVVLAIDSSELAQQAAALPLHHWLPRQYRLRLADADDERIEWVYAQQEQVTVHKAEPHLGWWAQLRLGLASALVSEELL